MGGREADKEWEGVRDEGNRVMFWKRGGTLIFSVKRYGPEFQLYGQRIPHLRWSNFSVALSVHGKTLKAISCGHTSVPSRTC